MEVVPFEIDVLDDYKYNNEQLQYYNETLELC